MNKQIICRVTVLIVICIAILVMILVVAKACKQRNNRVTTKSPKLGEKCSSCPTCPNSKVCPQCNPSYYNKFFNGNIYKDEEAPIRKTPDSPVRVPVAPPGDGGFSHTSMFKNDPYRKSPPIKPPKTPNSSDPTTPGNSKYLPQKQVTDLALKAEMAAARTPPQINRDLTGSPTLEDISKFLRANKFVENGPDFGTIYPIKLPTDKTGLMPTPDYYGDIQTYNTDLTAKMETNQIAVTCESRGCDVTPYGAGDKLPMSKAYDMPTSIFDLIKGAQRTVDIISLAPAPDGTFKNAIQAGLAEIDKSGRKVLVRMFFGTPFDPNIKVIHGVETYVGEFTTILSPGSSITILFGQMRSTPLNSASSLTWNHGKIINVDGSAMIIGGENMWATNYLAKNPIMDLTATILGNHSHAIQYVNEKFQELNMKLNEGYWGALKDLSADVINRRLDAGVIWKDGKFTNMETVSPATFSKLYMVDTLDNTQVIQYPIPSIPGKALPISRVPSSNNMDASTAARLYAMKNAKRRILMSQQSLDSITSKLTNTLDIEDRFYGDMVAAIGTAIMNGVTVSIITSTAVSVVQQAEAGLSNVIPFEPWLKKFYETYNSSQKPSFFRNKIKEWIGKQGLSPTKTASMVEKYLFQGNPSYDKKTPWFQHDKFWMVDDIFYIGSHNMYYCNLSEFGCIFEDSDTGNSIVKFVEDNYWNDKWEHSYRDEL